MFRSSLAFPIRVSIQAFIHKACGTSSCGSCELYFATPQTTLLLAYFMLPLGTFLSLGMSSLSTFKHGATEGTFLTWGRLRRSLPLWSEAGEAAADAPMPLLPALALPLDCWLQSSPQQFPLHRQWVPLLQQRRCVFHNLLTLANRGNQ